MGEGGQKAAVLLQSILWSDRIKFNKKINDPYNLDIFSKIRTHFESSSLIKIWVKHYNSQFFADTRSMLHWMELVAIGVESRVYMLWDVRGKY